MANVGPTLQLGFDLGPFGNPQEAEIVPIWGTSEASLGPVEAKFWSHFWEYALDPQKAKLGGIKNAQIEAPGTMFIPGNLYTIKIEHDGGLRIDSVPISKILLGERIPQQ